MNSLLSQMEKRLLEQDNQHDEAIQELRMLLMDLKESVEQNNRNTQELLDVYRSMKAFTNVLKWFERFAVWLAKIAIAAGIICVTMKFTVGELVAQITRGGK